jgi:hypothetical protein
MGPHRDASQRFGFGHSMLTADEALRIANAIAQLAGAAPTEMQPSIETALN